MDEISNETVASTTVPVNSNISAWLNNLDTPVHEGYRFDYFDIPDGDKNNVTNDMTVYIRYSAEGRYAITSYVKNGDIALDCKRSHWTYTGSAKIVIKFSKSFDTIEFNNLEIFDLSSTVAEDRQQESNIVGDNIISFIDKVIKTHDLYIIKLTSIDGKVGQVAWDSGFKPILVSVTQHGKTDLYKVVTNN